MLLQDNWGTYLPDPFHRDTLVADLAAPKSLCALTELGLNPKPLDGVGHIFCGGLQALLLQVGDFGISARFQLTTLDYFVR